MGVGGCFDVAVVESEWTCDNCGGSSSDGQATAGRRHESFRGKHSARSIACQTFGHDGDLADGHRLLWDGLLLVRQAGQRRGGDHFHGCFRRVRPRSSSVIALVVGARKRWALEAALPMAILMAAPVGMAGALTWLAPTMGGSLRRLTISPHYRGHIPTAVLGIARQTIPTGVILGAGFGAIVGLSILLARHRPRLVRWVRGGAAPLLCHWFRAHRRIRPRC